MPVVGGTYVNPFYRNVDNSVRAELNQRANYYGRRVRSTRAGAYETGIAWSYQKKSWARVKSVDPAYTLGMAGSKIMSNRIGDLTLYNSQRNVPNKALLKSLELSNEGTIGSLMKGKFTFILYPYMTTQGFELGVIERAFFTPGAEVEVSWGWSVSANNAAANNGRFKGIIYNFNWSVNPDLSITADCSIVSAATIAMGQSGDQSTAKDTAAAPVAVLGSPINGPNLASVIDKDLASPTFAAIGTLAPGTASPPIPGIEGAGIIPGVGTAARGWPGAGYIPEYWGIGLLHQEVEPETNAPAPAGTPPGSAVARSTAPPPPVAKTYFYTSLEHVVSFMNILIDSLEATGGAPNDRMSSLFEVQVRSNITAYNAIMKSAYPFDVFFPDDQNGFYGPACTPFPAANAFLRQIPGPGPGGPPPYGPVSGNTIAIGHILLGTDFIKNTYKEFVEDNSANIPYKNITSFFESIVKKINEATGDFYQLSVIQMDRPVGGFSAPGAAGVGYARANRSILSIEDSHISETASAGVIPYQFGANIFKPLIKSAQISCKPPAAMATAAYAGARGSGPANMKPNNALVDSTRTADKDVASFNQERTGNPAGTPPPPGAPGGAFGDIFSKAFNASLSGFNNSWGEQFRGALVTYKKMSVDRPGNTAHWLHAAAYPIDFTLTIDGINGFKFGDTISTTVVPKRYNTLYNMVFTVTKISHKIDEGGWETTLNTKARIEMAP
jgi:hypothetical protein